MSPQDRDWIWTRGTIPETVADAIFRSTTSGARMSDTHSDLEFDRAFSFYGPERAAGLPVPGEPVADPVVPEVTETG